MKIDVYENEEYKQITSPIYNYQFNKKTGLFLRWGKTKKDNPIFAPYPEIADIEITTICKNNCSYCYKDNTEKGINMSLETFKIIIDKLVPFLTQVALGTDSSGIVNPNIFNMMLYCKQKKVVPNITVANINQDIAKKFAQLVGACAVSYHQNKEYCYNSIKLLLDAGLKQVNMHYVLSQETYEDAFNIINDIKNNSKLENLNALIFLALKNKGRGDKYHTLDQKQFNTIIDYAQKKEIPIGFDSCHTKKYLDYVKDDVDYENKKVYVESCESTLFSSYFNVKGEFFPCSFVEGYKDWEKGIAITKDVDFLKDVWFHEKTKKFRKLLLDTKQKNTHLCRECPYFNI